MAKTQLLRLRNDGDAHRRAQDLRQALAAYEAAAALDPTDEVAEVVLAARRELQEARDACVLSGDEAAEQEEFTAAQEHYISALKLEPQSDLLHAKLSSIQSLHRVATQNAVSAGEQAFKEKNYGQAVEHFARASKHNPNDADIRTALERAKHNQTQVVEKRLALAKVHLGSDEYMAAVEQLREALYSDPSRADVQHALKAARSQAIARNQYEADGEADQVAEGIIGRAKRLGPSECRLGCCALWVGLTLHSLTVLCFTEPTLGFAATRHRHLFAFPQGRNRHP